MKRLRHRWGKIMPTTENASLSESICVRCGCERHMSCGIYIYNRSGICFESCPECIDWELENAKTID